MVRSISGMSPTSGVVYLRVETDHGPTLEDSALAFLKVSVEVAFVITTGPEQEGVSCR